METLSGGQALGVPVALKIFSPALADDESFKAISREVLITRRLSHPAICKLHDLHQEKVVHRNLKPWNILVAEAGPAGLP